MYRPNGLLTLEKTKRDVDLDPHIIAPDPLFTDDCLDAIPLANLFLLTKTEELNMNASEDEPLSGLNGRLRPRKSHTSSPQNKSKSKSESKISQERTKRISTPSKASPNKQDDLANKSDFSPTPQLLCPYCDKKFASKQTVSKHIRRMHYSTSKQDAFLGCLFCNHTEADSNIIRHMVDSHPNQYFACLDCHTRFPSTSELAEHKLNVCEKQKVSFRKLRQKGSRGTKKSKKTINIDDKSDKDFQDGHGFNGIVISCELKPSQVHEGADIEDNITTNLILPPSKNLGNSTVLEKNAVIVLDDIQWNKRIPPNFSFHNTDADQILSRLGVVHRSPRTGESTRKDWFKGIDDSTQKFERCFDTKFYSKVASNVQENLNKFLDGSFNFNPDPDQMIKTRKSKNSVVINTAEGFPILLACEQFSRGIFDNYMPRALAPKHKWKWDNLENDKTPISPDQIRRDSHTNNCIITLVSSLDIWTQLSMRRKFEDKFNTLPIEKKTEKQNIISKELKEILESREIPKQSQIVSVANRPAPSRHAAEFPAFLGLAPAAPSYSVQPAVLSGEWVRPRCYVCCACGEKTMDPKGLTSHISTQHPNAHVQYYEIVGEPLLNPDILKHLYVPPSQVCNRTRPPRGFRECTKCRKSVTLEDLHQHMLDCAGDTPTVRRRQCRYRPFGVRRRRPRMPDVTIRKKMRKDIRSRQRRQKSLMRPRPRVRTEVGDAETIRKMLADLPAKRHRVLVNPINLMQRPRRKLDQQRSKLMLKKCPPEEDKIKRRRINNVVMHDGTANNDDQNKNSSSVDDEEDNKPLKPKLKRLLRRTTRQRESLKRQAVVNRAKRRSVRVEQRKVVDNEGSNNTGIEEVSIDKTPQKIDVKRGSYNSREHGNRGTTNSRDDQRPGCSGTNGAANNACAPTQSVPLKHSIARLTANSETHDKAVQFHHLFLVHQECNDRNEHVPTGRQTLFENEAVVSKLDKPPLNFCQKSLLDLQALQKNKLNKPRKGLNDCIAMLKNKLVDPIPHDGIAHVSVQCGTDEPIETDPRITAAADAGHNLDKLQNKSNQTILMENQYALEKQVIPFGFGQDAIQITQKNEEPVKRRSSRGKALSRTDAETNKQNRKSRTDASVSPQKPKNGNQAVPEACIGSQKSKRDHQSGHEVFISSLKSNTDNQLDLINPQKSKINLSNTDVFDSTKQTKFDHHLITDVFISPQKTKSDQQPNQDVFINPQKTKIDPQSKTDALIRPQKTKSYKKSNQEVFMSPQNTKIDNQSNLEVFIAPQKTKPDQQLNQDVLIRQQEVNIGHQINPDILIDVQKSTSVHQSAPENFVIPQKSKTDSQLAPEVFIGSHKTIIETDHPEKSPLRVRSQSILSQQALDIENDTHQRPVQVYTDSAMVAKPPATTFKPESTLPKPAVAITTTANEIFEQNIRESPKWSTMYLDNTAQKQTDVHQECDLSLQLPSNAYMCSELMDIPIDIPPAHASTNVESIISTPLDLSSKVVGAVYSNNMDNYVGDYDVYETLDLSNKSIDNRVMLESNDEDVVVDLRVKPSQPRSPQTSLDLCVNQNTMCDISMAASLVDNYPTDLSFKGKDLSDHRMDDINVVQDLSSSKSGTLENEVDNFSVMKTTASPTDLSGKSNKVTNVKYTELNTGSNVSSRIAEESLTKSSVGFNNLPTPQPLKNHSELQAKTTPKIETLSKTISDHKKVTEKSSLRSPPPRFSDRSLHLQKPVYDPTLKIPQYRIRADTSVPEAPAMMPVTEDTIRKTHIPPPSENSPYGFVNTSAKASSDSVEAPSVHSLSSRAVTSIACKIESTTPVYTLGNACISVTKIETSNTNKLTNAPLSIPGSTIASSTPIYTLTGTTIKCPVQLGENDSQDDVEAYTNYSTQCELLSSITNEDSAFHKKSEMRKEIVKHNLPVVDQDPETAKKIAMLPKELVDILGNMPVDHRNQLLNVLPQYVSTTVASTETLQTSNMTTLTTNSKMTTAQSQDIMCSSNIVSSQSTLNQLQNSSYASTNLFSKSASDPIYSTPYNITSAIPAIVSKDKSQDVDMSVRSLQCPKDEVAKIEPSIPIITSSANVIERVITQDRIIDLTEDDHSSLNVHVPKVVDVTPRSITFPSPEIGGGITLGKPIKQKSSDKTASLRAVRIKAPAERQKENLLLKRTSIDQVSNINQTESDDNEANKLSESNKSLAIQQAEVSSTQHSNKTANVEAKYVAENLPAEQDTCSEDQGIKSRRSSILACDNIETEKNKTLECFSENLPVKSLVSSSVPIKNLKRSSSNEVSGNNGSDIGHDDKVNELLEDSTIPELNKDLKSNSTTLDEVTDKEKVEPLENPKECSRDVLQDEEDSEDDIILAAIVKQKQQIETKCDKKSKSTVSHDIKNIPASKKKKKSKRISKIYKCQKEELISDINELSSIAKKSAINSHESVCTSKYDNNNCKIKLGKDITDHEPVTVNDTGTTIDINQEQCYDKSLDIDSKSISTNTTELTEINNINKVDDTPDKTVSDVSVSETSELHDVKIVKSLEQIGNLKQKSKTKKQQSKVCENKSLNENDLNTDVRPTKKIDVSEENQPKNDIGEVNGKEDLEVGRTDHTDISSIQDEDVLNDMKNNKKAEHMRKTLECINDKSISRDIEENISIIPLRRSRRGKSLFVDSNMPEHEEITNIDISLDQKTPLTKKQLIFSKLMLDEENLSKSINSSQENKIDGKQSDNPDMKNQTVSNETESAIDEDQSKSLPIKKLKSVKRKKSPQSKKKLKKKKSSDLSPHINDNFTDDSQSENNISSMENSRTDTVTKKIEASETDEEKSNKDGIKVTINQIEDTYQTESSNASEKADFNTNVTSSSEKRRITNSTTIDSSYSSKPKKVKYNINEEFDPKDDNKDFQIEVVQKDNKSEFSIAVDKRVTCYNMPVAARRTRSKSVGVTSSVTESYDPYDIDLDETIEKTESLKKCVPKSKDVKTKTKITTKMTDPKTKKYVVNTEIEVPKSEVKKKTDSNTSNAKNSSASERTLKITNDKGVGKKGDNAKPVVKDLTETTSRKKRVSKIIESPEYTKDSASDSDESSKSDVPLKKYAEEKVKKLSETIRSERESQDTDTIKSVAAESKQSNKKNKKTKRNSDTNHNVEDSGVSNETEEQLRSEQFMESFGFFSERKPRKSNLLATKKISETFHIIASESDDLYFGPRDRTTKKTSQIECKRAEDSSAQPSTSRKNLKRGRKKKIIETYTKCYCDVCKKEFRRPDNYIRHQMTLLHVSKLSEVELNVKTAPVHEEPNYLLAYKIHLEKFKQLTDKLKRKKGPKVKIIRPTVEEVMADVEKTMREQERERRRKLSRDEALFLDCCELLKESHKPDVPIPGTASFDCAGPSTSVDLDYVKKSVVKCDSVSDGDVDSITAKTIMESEEVRNLENDIVSGFQVAANANHHAECCNLIHHEVSCDRISSPDLVDSHSNQMKSNDDDDDFDVPMEPDLTKSKKYPEYKDKMYPDVEDIDMFEDKFDKIKRKCRSQAAAAKLVQTVVKPSSGQGRKKSEKKKGKKSSKKNYQNTVLTKGALKGFDGIKVSIPTTDINMSSIATSQEVPLKKKKKTGSKKRREKRDSETSNDYRFKEGSSQKKVDVYEFMDNEDAELFELRPSTLMERFKNISNKDENKELKERKDNNEMKDHKDFKEPKEPKQLNELTDNKEPKEAKKSKEICESNQINYTKQLDEDEEVLEFKDANENKYGKDNKEIKVTGTSENKPGPNQAANGHSPTSVSDGDDFVYMSDDYLCSDGEVEVNISNESDVKKPTSSKRKDAVEKNAVMGKIFKHAARSERKSKKETVKPKANLDQLFDSLLEEEPSSSMLQNDSDTSKKEETIKKTEDPSAKETSFDNKSSSKDAYRSNKKAPSSSPERFITTKTSSPINRDAKPNLPDYTDDDSNSSNDVQRPAKYNTPVYEYVYGPSTSKRNSSIDIYGPSTSTSHLESSPDIYGPSTSNSNRNLSPCPSTSKRNRATDIYGPSTSSSKRNLSMDIFTASTSKRTPSDSYDPSTSTSKRTVSPDIYSPSTSTSKRNQYIDTYGSSTSSKRNTVIDIHGPGTSSTKRDTSIDDYVPSTLTSKLSISMDIFGPSASTSKRNLGTDIYGPSTSTSKRDTSHDVYGPSTSTSKRESSIDIYPPSTSTAKQDTSIDIYRPSTSKMYNTDMTKDCKASTPKKRENSSIKKYVSSSRYHSPSLKDDEDSSDVNDEPTKRNSPARDVDKSYEFNHDDDTGVARQRARRKCTVGKQNVLAETWSSESEPDGLPARPNSAESGVVAVGRKKKGRKKDSQLSLGRRGKVAYKKQDSESRVTSSNRNTSSSGASSITGPRISSGIIDKSPEESSSAVSPGHSCGPPAPAPLGALAAGSAQGSKVRPRAAAYYWSSEGDEEQEHKQQHGWIVGDSHKKLVTMLAHAKGRKRNSDDKRHLVE